MARLFEIHQLLYLPSTVSQEEALRKMVRAVDLFESLEPADGAEEMLALQMVGTHAAAMECLARAAVPELNFAGSNLAMKHAQSLLALYMKQLEAWNRHRGKGQQNVTVRHVHVEVGRQAIVGKVEAARFAPESLETRLQDQKPSPAAEVPPPGEVRIMASRRTQVRR